MVKPEITHNRPTNYSYYHRRNGLKCWFGDLDGHFYIWASYEGYDEYIIHAIAEIKSGNDNWPDKNQQQVLDAWCRQFDGGIYLIQYEPSINRFLVYDWRTKKGWEHLSEEEHTQWIKEVVLKC